MKKRAGASSRDYIEKSARSPCLVDARSTLAQAPERALGTIRSRFQFLLQARRTSSEQFSYWCFVTSCRCSGDGDAHRIRHTRNACKRGYRRTTFDENADPQ